MGKRQIVDHIRIMNFRFVNTFFLGGFLLFLLSITNGKAFAQDQAREFITGTISDASTGEPLPGVNILVKGTSAGIFTPGRGSPVEASDIVPVINSLRSEEHTSEL